MSKYYYWLIPDEPHRSRLQQIIHNFSRVYRGPSFAPHITLGTGQYIPPSPCTQKVVSIRFQCVESADQYFRALYYRCEESSTLLSLAQKYGMKNPYCPHLSLLYGEHSDARKRTWCRNTLLYTEEVMCSNIWIVKGAPKVEHWETVQTHTLSP